MKIAIMTFADNTINAYSQYSIKRFQQYADLNNYDFILGTKMIDKDRHPSWGKIEMFREHLKNYDLVAFFDADIWINNLNMKVESFIPDNMFMAISVNGDNGGRFLNCGAIIAKNNYQVSAFIDDIWSHKSNKDVEPFWEQDIVNDLYELYQPIIQTLPMRAINSYWLDNPINHPDNNVYHYMARTTEQKEAFFKLISEG